MPASSRPCTSSRIASASCSAVSASGWSSRTNDHLSIVTGPVSIPFTGLSVSDCAYVVHSTVMAWGRDALAHLRVPRAGGGAAVLESLGVSVELLLGWSARDGRELVHLLGREGEPRPELVVEVGLRRERDRHVVQGAARRHDHLAGAGS